MKANFLNYFYLLMLMFITLACSNERLESMGVIKKKANQYSVSRKAPLEMPPDMYLRPPKEKKEIDNIAGNVEEGDLSLDDILANKDISKDKTFKKKNINKDKQDRILNKILRAKVNIILN